MASWLVAGLGNPGPAYAETRHNVGFAVVERLAAEAGTAFRPEGFQAEAAAADLAGTPVLLCKPLAYMNRSGGPVAACLDALGLPPERLVVVHDDLDLPLGRLRLSQGAGSGGHRGVAAIQAALGTVAFPRVRVGIGRPPGAENAADHVLAVFSEAERPLAAEVILRAAAAVRHLIGEGLASAMNQYNAWTAPGADAPA